MLDLVPLFDALQPPPLLSGAESVRFSASPIPGYEQHRIGADHKGNPALLIAVHEAPERVWMPPIELEHLSVQHDVICRVLQANGVLDERQVTVVSCVGADRMLRIYFLHVAATLIVSLGTLPTRSDVSRTVDRLAELFRAMREPARKSVQGLWAELFLISRVRDPNTVLAAWHTNPEDLYDFSADNQKIEVKSTISHIRQHHFRLEQLHPPDGTTLLVASILVERTGSGSSVIDLAHKIRVRLNNRPELLMHIDRLIGLTLGESWRYAVEDSFSMEMAELFLGFFEPNAIPCVSLDLPVGVSDVRFKSDLTAVPTADLAAYRKMGGLFAAALRR